MNSTVLTNVFDRNNIKKTTLLLFIYFFYFAIIHCTQYDLEKIAQNEIKKIK